MYWNAMIEAKFCFNKVPAFKPVWHDSYELVQTCTFASQLLSFCSLKTLTCYVHIVATKVF